MYSRKLLRRCQSMCRQYQLLAPFQNRWLSGLHLLRIKCYRFYRVFLTDNSPEHQKGQKYSKHFEYQSAIA